MKLLLISNSTNAGEAYLGWTLQYITDFMHKYDAKKVAFVPYAGVNLSPISVEESYNVYENKVKSVFNKLGFELESVHHSSNPVKMIQEAECIAVGGGNTFHLVGMMHKLGLMDAIRQQALKGVPYMGWSAGSNVACPSMKTTNDMPIYQPESFDCLNLIPFQINPHYLDANPEGHGGETRQQRIEEFLTVNRNMIVVGLREACLLELENGKLLLKGKRPLRIFEYGKEPVEIESNTNVSFLL